MDKCLYFNGLSVLKDNFNYCIDMIRLSCRIPVSVFEQKVNNRLFVYGDCLKSWVSTKITDFYYNFNYSTDEYSFWFGYISNKEKINGKSLRNENTLFNLTVEFNPNKVKDCPLLLKLLKLSTEWLVKQVDFAIDVPTNICNICGFDKGKKACLITYDCGNDDKTFYIGKTDNRVKVYNKTIESGLNYDLTRIEITKCFKDLKIDCVRYYKYDGYVPELFLKDFQLSINDFSDKTLFAIVYAVLEGFPLHDLSKHYKKRVKDFLNKKKPIKIDFSCLDKCLVNYIFHYFPFI